MQQKLPLQTLLKYRHNYVIANKNLDFLPKLKLQGRFVKAISPPAMNIVFIVPDLIAIIPPNRVKITL